MARKKKVKLLLIPPGLPPLLFILIFLLLYLGLNPSRPVTLFGVTPLEGVTVVLDPSHGGIDPGVHHEEGGKIITEKEVTLAVSLKLRELLKLAGANVIMTRETDQDTSDLYDENSFLDRYHRDLAGRVKVINESNADLFISLHVNSCYDPTIRGAIAFYSNANPQNKLLAEIVQENINPVVIVNPRAGQFFHQNTREGDYYILNCSNIPGIILEFSFMTSPDDRELLQQESYRDRIARAVFWGVAEYIYARDK